jgi:hypothetical protein
MCEDFLRAGRGRMLVDPGVRQAYFADTARKLYTEQARGEHRRCLSTITASVLQLHGSTICMSSAFGCASAAACAASVLGQVDVTLFQLVVVCRC